VNSFSLYCYESPFRGDFATLQLILIKTQ